MAGEFVSLGVQKLWDLLSQEYELFQGVEDQVTELKSDLNLLKSFLNDADNKKHTSALVRHCMEEIKEIVYDAEDVIETFLSKEKLCQTSEIRKRIRRIACIIPDRREIALYIGVISNRISRVIRNMKSFGIQQIIADDSLRLLHDKEREIRQTFSKDYESDLVGLEASVKKLVEYLVEKDDIQIVSVTGMGGLGKTTLARQVFNHKDVNHQFDRLAWVCVSQEFTRISVWQTILQNLTSSERKAEILHMKEAELRDEISLLLETSKSLIVFDDVWKEEDWDLLKPIFPLTKGWKVLLTSRNERVALHGNTKYLNFKPECLTIQDSWTLFQRITMPQKDAPEFKVDVEMEEMGKQMIKHCGGLPLAVKVLGGLLAANYTMHDWKRLSKNIGSHIVRITSGNNGSIDSGPSMSFEGLPSYLKHCFLYMAHFPEDHKINVNKLSYYWAAEGISDESRHYNGETIRDVGDRYIEELVRRNMVISERSITTLRFETCRLHDMMREVCLFKAKEENFLQIVGTSSSTAYSQPPVTSRRFVSHNPKALRVERHKKISKIRSFMVVSNDVLEDNRLVSGLIFTKLQLLRLLDLSRAKFEGGKLPSSIGKLIHLKYLSFQDAKVSRLAYSLQNLKLLIYLNLDVFEESSS